MSDHFDVLVTGSEGFLGRATVTRLREAGLRVAAADLLKRSPGDPDYRRVDVRDPAQVADLLEESVPTVVVHLASAMDVTGDEPGNIVHTNVLGTSNVLDAALAASARRFVYGSSVMVYGAPAGKNSGPVTEAETPAPQTLYGAAKVFVENLAQQPYYRDRIQTASLRFTTIYGAGRTRRGACPFVVDAFRAAGLQEPIGVNVCQRTDVVHVRDAAEAILAAVSAPAPIHGVYNVGHHEVAGEDIIDVVRTLRPDATIERETGVPSSWPFRVSSERAAFELDWRPRYSLSEGAAEAIRWFELHAEETEAQVLRDGSEM